ncbi:MAG: HigA family addiction module antitoxin [Gammaproteobacteria bacterium]|nr:HigA family addiction module antitoxin [Gammaproteobacteria bacterium]
MTGPIHPGVTLREDFMEPYELSTNRLAKALGISRNRIIDIVRGRSGGTADTALRLEHAFNVSASFWLNLQSHYELELATRDAGRLIEEKSNPTHRCRLNPSPDQ